jgi:hypothetical protein
VVGNGDYDVFGANFGMTSGADWTMGDFDYNGTVDNGDYDILGASWGTVYPGVGGANVPEPTTMGLLALGVIGLISRRRNRK